MARKRKHEGTGKVRGSGRQHCLIANLLTDTSSLSSKRNSYYINCSAYTTLPLITKPRLISLKKTHSGKQTKYLNKIMMIAN